MTIRKIFAFLFQCLLFVSVSSAYAINPEDLLKPEEAFKVSAQAIDGKTIKVNWDIAEGYYLYRTKLGFSTKTEGITLDTPTFPAGEIKKDKYFGDMEIYHGKVSIDIPVKRSGSDPLTLELMTKSQGCAEAGICYPPQKKMVSVQLAALAANQPANPSMVVSDSVDSISAPAGSGAAGGIGGLIQDLGISRIDGSNEPLPADEAFVFDLLALDKNRLIARWKVTPGHYLYKDKIKFKLESPDGVQLNAASFPAAKQKHDEYFGDIEIYEHDFDIRIPVSGANGREITVLSQYQGCSEITGICYPPLKKTITLALADAPDAAVPSSPSSTTGQTISNTPENAAGVTATQAVQTPEQPVSEQDAILNQISTGSMIGTILSFFLVGIGLALTPCVFPMIPILSGIIAGQGNNLSTRKAFGLSLAYVLPMAIVFAIVGVIAGLGGANLQILFQNPWVISAFALLFVLLAFSMFGFYDLQMPASIQSKLNNLSNKQESGSYIGAAIMGVLSALIVGPCVTAPLIAALTYIAQTGDAIFGGLTLFALGLGMGTPLLLVGISAGKLLPKAGAWMDATKAIFGVMMLGLAIWMLERILPIEIIMVLTGILLIVSGVYMGALNVIPEGVSKWKYLWKGVGFVILLYGALMLIGVATGSKNLLYPLKGSFAGAGNNSLATEQSLKFQPVKGISGLQEALEIAKKQNRTVMLDFYADWCISCKEMEHKTFTDANVINVLKDTMLIQADVTANDEKDQALLKYFGLFGPPGIMFFTPDGKENKAYRLVGEVPPKRFAAHVEKFLSLGQ
jgi:thiol:disulfide interchange protein DsbD